ncbi:MAG TPA: class I SAM-dependent methyltransferase [Ilumatobacteraceae bacterium]
MAALDIFDQPALWRVEAAAALGLDGEQLIAAVSPGPAYPEALRSLVLALPECPRLIVDLGAGGGGPSEWLRTTTGAAVYAVEPAPGARQAAQRAFPNLRVLDGRADDAPLPGGVADVVILSGVLSLLDDVEPVLEEVERILTTGGRVAIADLFSADSTTWSSGSNTFRSIEDLIATLRRRGFTVSNVGVGEPVPDPTWSAVAKAVDDWIDAHRSNRPGYEAWRSDRRRLGDLARSGKVVGGCLTATQNGSEPNEASHAIFAHAQPKKT